VPLNEWLRQNSDIITSYFNKLLDVENDPETYLNVSRYADLAQTNKVEIYISINEIYSLHKFIEKHCEQLAPDPNDKLRIIMNDLGSAPQEVPKEMNTYIHLPLFSRFQTSLQDVEAISATEQLFNDTKYALISVLRETPNIYPTTASLIEVIHLAKQYATKTENNQLLDQINKLLQNFTELEEKSFITKADNYSKLVKSLTEDVNARTTLRRTMESQKNSIEAVLKEIRLHQSYLHGQISQYREYLQNCRINSVKPLKLKKRHTKSSVSKKKRFRDWTSEI